ncbi:hypothetical protein BDZ90DRAFT_234311 [Jaminaea rosea]|uniref:Uncharacterized protein n=1 Tax=Jaminaea rosea TaxID=1569628 RepID=A0A316UID4_9BASI|nr:hypothetical protein BDZ90DRAFT_234311 [Jaminaea rosea]PWN25097.1 hypothetical protein BDZ90DRAFT_234311 [Jaminaea rosea]
MLRLILALSSLFLALTLNKSNVEAQTGVLGKCWTKANCTGFPSLVVHQPAPSTPVNCGSFTMESNFAITVDACSDAQCKKCKALNSKQCAAGPVKCIVV